VKLLNANLGSTLKIIKDFFVLFVALHSTVAIAQSKKNCSVQVSGYAESLRLAYLDATNKAYYELVAQCGNGVKISSTVLDEVNSSQSDYTTNTYESMLVGLGGLVTNFEVIDSSKSSLANGRFVEVKMYAKGTVYSDSAAASSISVDGINPIYKEGDFLTFDVTSDEDMNLWVYQVTDESASLFFPNDKYLPVLKIKKDETLHFPPLGNIRARLENEDISTQVINWVIIATKRKDPWISQMDINELIERYSAQKGKKDIKVLKAAITR